MKGYDYSQAGAYFITQCVQDRRCVFGEIKNGEIILNTYGQIANDQWHELSKRFNNIELDEFIGMPNHIHGIVVINDQENGGHKNNMESFQ